MHHFLPNPHPGTVSAWQTDPCASVVLLTERKILLVHDDNRHRFPLVRELSQFPFPEMLDIGMLNGCNCYAALLSDFPSLDACDAAEYDLRLTLTQLNEAECFAQSRARHLLYWRKQHRFCGGCGKQTESSKNDVALLCPACGMRFYPQLAPAIIVGITRGNEILLAHNKSFQPEIFGLIAGFVEAGENLEQAVHREIFEETGITVKNIRYASSQSWPFPNALMLGFFAEYESGEARPDGEEISNLGWFSAKNLPKIPHSGSIARMLIETFLAEQS